MSTLTSVDMNLNRSSTRLHAPPGGKSSLCLGTYAQDENIANSRPPTTNNIFGQEEEKIVKPVRQQAANNIFGQEEIISKPVQQPAANNIFGQEKETVVKPAQQPATNNIFGTDDVVQQTRRPSVNNIFATEETESELEKKRQAARRPSNSQGMSSIMTSQENEVPTSARRVRQAPGGASTFTLG